MEDVRRAVLSPDDLLDYKLFSYAPTACCSMPSDINVKLTQVYSINHYQENTRASSLTIIKGKMSDLTWFAGRCCAAFGLCLCM
jgi:hypothetical protein